MENSSESESESKEKSQIEVRRNKRNLLFMDIIQRSKRVNLCKFFFLGKRMNTKKKHKIENICDDVVILMLWRFFGYIFHEFYSI